MDPRAGRVTLKEYAEQWMEIAYAYNRLYH